MTQHKGHTMKTIDLHVHSTFSDGTQTPTELVKEAVACGLRAFALTDHDSTKGIEEALEAARTYDLEVIPGIELSTALNGKEIHILGHYINPYNESLSSHLERFVQLREERNHKICSLLREQGIDITYEKLRARFPDAIITKMHFVVYMLEQGDIKTIQEGFNKYVGDGAPCYVPRERITPFEAIDLIREAGGLPTFAHPILCHYSENELDTLVGELKKAGLAGIESIYSTYAPADERLIRKLAAKYDLFITGGSDYHGKNKPDISLGKGRGNLFIPEDLLDAMQAKYLENFSTHEKNLMFFDMDGTLLNDKKQISELTGKALEEAIKKGHVFSISTGRPLSSIKKLAASLDLIKYKPLIAAFNGGLIWDSEKDEIINPITMDHEIAKSIIERIKEIGFHFHTYSQDEVLAERETEEVKFYSNYVNLEYRIVPDALEISPNPYKIIIMNLKDPDALIPIQKEIMNEFGDQLQCLFSNRNFLELLPLNSGKGQAIHTMCDYLGIPESNTYAFADAENDITMLVKAAHGVCMLNGTAEAKKAADYITFQTNDNDGLVPFIQELSK